MHYQPKQDLLQNRIILVTGASDGIGREAALTYARYGATVILLGRNEEKLRRVAQHIADEQHVQPQWFTLDLLTCTAEECRQVADRIAAHYPRLDGVLHNAGLLGEIGPMSEQDPQIWQDVMQVNVNATFMLTQALLPLLLKSDAGSLVFTSSSVGRQGRANWGAYATSKFATEGMMQVLADEYQNRSLRVNCISINPGGTRTSMRASAFPTEDPQKLKTPADIMPLYLWLMGDDSRRKTGMTFDAQPGRKPGIAQ
ncbi:YciK family oxidoreductase [Salmonella enterica subsp. enterica serovar Typhi]|nr:YciK family oxidoreductase [Salmonella enterica subsp. enterica serovar Typhi]